MLRENEEKLELDREPKPWKKRAPDAELQSWNSQRRS